MANNIQDISKIIRKINSKHSRFMNEYLSFLIEFVKNFEKPTCVANPIIQDKAERSVALTLVNLKHYQNGHHSSKTLYSQCFKANSIELSPTSSLKIELSNLVNEMYSSQYWKAIALMALEANNQYPRIFFDLSPVRESKPWLSPDLKKNRRGKLNEQID